VALRDLLKFYDSRVEAPVKQNDIRIIPNTQGSEVFITCTRNKITKVLHVTNYGQSWSTVYEGNSYSAIGLNEIVYNPLNINMWWVAQGKKAPIPDDYFCLMTENMGQTWEEINNYPPTDDYPQPIYTIAVNPISPNILYIGDDDAMGSQPPSPIHMWKSKDFGKSWFALENALPYDNHDIYDVAVDPVQPDTLYVSAYYGVYKSYNGGNTFQRLNLDVENNWITVDRNRQFDIYQDFIIFLL